MKKYFRTIRLLAICLAGALCLVGWQASTSGTLDSSMLKKALEDIGYEPKDLSKDPEKPLYEVTIVREGLNIPVSSEVTSSKSYLWLTVTMGSLKEDAADAAKLRKLLVANGVIQPSHFFITKGDRLKLAMPIDNRGVTNAILRKAIDRIVNNVVETKAIWQ